jgi:hypothetical protein
MIDSQILGRGRTFVVRVWYEAGSDTTRAAAVTCRGSVIDVLTGGSRSFACADELAEIIARIPSADSTTARSEQ